MNSMSATKADKIRSASLIELKTLAGWFDLNYGTTIILIGGWAVYSYNPYQGSFDVDCVGPRSPFYRQLNVYMSSHGYTEERTDLLGLRARVYVKHIYEENARIGDVHIDACYFKDENPFRENNTKKLPYGLCAEPKYLSRGQINGSFVRVPVKELLFLYKLKALRDRMWRISNEPLSNEDKYFIQGKIDKDKTDLLALTDPKYSPLNPSQLLDLIKNLNLEFVIATIKDLPNQQAAITEYKKTRADIEGWVNKILLDMGVS